MSKVAVVATILDFLSFTVTDASLGPLLLYCLIFAVLRQHSGPYPLSSLDRTFHGIGLFWCEED